MPGIACNEVINPSNANTVGTTSLNRLPQSGLVLAIYEANAVIRNDWDDR
jgi:hypothetical protein